MSTKEEVFQITETEKALGPGNLITKIKKSAKDFENTYREIDKIHDKLDISKIKISGNNVTVTHNNENSGDAAVSYFDMITATATAQNAEEIYDIVYKMAHPNKYDREEASEIFEDALGFNPTNYWDKKEISMDLELFENSGYDPEVKNNHDTIVNDALEIYENSRALNHAMSIKKAMNMAGIDQETINEYNNFGVLASDSEDDNIEASDVIKLNKLLDDIDDDDEFSLLSSDESDDDSDDGDYDYYEF